VGSATAKPTRGPTSAHTGFTPTGSMGTVRSNHTATLLPDGRVLIAEGFDGSNFISSAELYQP